MAKQWLGKRQNVLLYDISTSSRPGRIYYDSLDKTWYKILDGAKKAVSKRFFCLSMLSLTNESINGISDIQFLLTTLREHILDIVDSLNSTETCSIECEVLGTFNASEVGILFLSDQYVEVLKIIDYIKHIRIVDNAKTVHPAFLASFSTIAVKFFCSKRWGISFCAKE